ncbi:hypothetical protein EV207_10854 [Scopulibacillus darangshiensis]|uniref:Uncharacterized protein n=1 Tax=Scopulibacillus darangshiensis TaxID=442528 RepID=A0A4R2P4S3_9BACL|nr:hypothetical protein [Scopulibacillus darangshiensis]TCP29762.1 hypothetical protein EV207_10854 [Scopulibacillus darangshiensis]
MGKSEALLWSIAFPGFGQLIDRQYIKGVLLVILEIVINVQAHFNDIIVLSFNGHIHAAIEAVNIQWLMFYPCVYFFSMWDAYRNAKGEKDDGAFLPFVFSAYFVTLGLIFSSEIRLFGILFGPVFLPMVFLIPGLIFGLIIKFFMNKKRQPAPDSSKE